ncbi:MAG: glutathione S-transferase family protein [Alphaproteobacteria bacterium]
MKIYHAPETRSTRIIWLFEELGLPYELETFKLGSPDMRAEDYLKVHPMGRVPALDDSEVTIFESGAIVEYVLARYGNGALVPDQASPDFAEYLQWLHYAEGMLMPPVNTIVVEKFFLSEARRNQVNIDRATKLLTRMLGAVEQRLFDRDYLAGDFSGADIMSGHATIVAARLGADITDKPNVAVYIERLKARPALQAAYAAAA